MTDTQLQPVGELGGIPRDAGEGLTSGLCWGHDVLGLTSPENRSRAGDANGNLSWSSGSLVISGQFPSLSAAPCGCRGRKGT